MHLNKNQFVNLVLATCILCWVTLYNGFPILYGDSATYIKSGFILETPADRPITYSLFLVLTSLYKTSLFLPVIFQNALLAWLLLQTHLRCLGTARMVWFLPVILLLSVFTGLPWVSNQIFADLFTAVLFLSAFLILSSEKDTPAKTIFLYFLFFLAAASHLSHISIALFFLLLSLPLLLWARFSPVLPQRKTGLKRLGALALVGLSAILVMGSAIDKSSAVFFTGKLCENGILKKYLDENCGRDTFKLCEIKNELVYPATEFIWSPEGATSKLGGWTAAKPEYERIDRAILHSTHYLKLLAAESVKSSLLQCGLNNTGEGNTHILKNENVVNTVNRFFPREYALFVQSRQARNQIDFDGFNAFYTWCYRILVSLFFILLLRKLCLKQFDFLSLFALLVIAGIAANHILGASLANAIGRFGLRVIWLPVFSAGLMLVDLTGSGANRKDSIL